MLSRKIYLTIVFIIGMLPALFFAQLWIDPSIGDNNLYANGYDLLNLSFSNHIYNYFLFQTLVNASIFEPLLFMYNLSCTILGFSYKFSYLLLNIFFIVSIGYLVVTRLKLTSSVLLTIFFLSANYYFILLLSDLHKLKLSFLVIIWVSILSLPSKYYLLAVLGHIQVFLLLPFLYLRNISFSKILLKKNTWIFCLLPLPFIAFSVSKLNYYFYGNTQIFGSFPVFSLSLVLFR